LGEGRAMKITADKIRILILLAFIIPVNIYLFNDFMYSRPSPNDQLVHGYVVKREMGTTTFGIVRPILTVQIQDTGENVNAVLSLSGINDIPANVTFYYSGDPSQEVYLLEETNPIWGFMLFLIMSVMLLAVLTAMMLLKE
jgi:hypothetical protein